MGQRKKSVLALEDGSIYRGYSFAAQGMAGGEVVFNTSMTGYQEILTDPSYRGQIIAMTYPLIGNTGVNPEDVESSRVQVAGFIVKELSGIPSNWRHSGDLESYLAENGIPGLCGIDTRALVRKLRSGGVLRGVISARGESEQELVQRAREIPGFESRDLLAEVTTAEPYHWDERERIVPLPAASKPLPPEKRVVVYDFGVKRNILRMLVSRGCRVEVVPARTAPGEVLERKPDGVVLSNGPGDPASVPYPAEIARELLGRIPLMGICLGHQILALAVGGQTFKLKFGHRGGNQPVMDRATGKVEITSQNHGYAVDTESLAGKPVTVSHVNLNDGTVEGMWSSELDFFSVQYHPEASPGPHDASYLFNRFIERIKTGSNDAGGGG
jgi:carbamoyl-phosphate synthase small subunit